MYAYYAHYIYLIVYIDESGASNIDTINNDMENILAEMEK